MVKSPVKAFCLSLDIWFGDNPSVLSIKIPGLGTSHDTGCSEIRGNKNSFLPKDCKKRYQMTGTPIKIVSKRNLYLLLANDAIAKRHRSLAPGKEG